MVNRITLGILVVLLFTFDLRAEPATVVELGDLKTLAGWSGLQTTPDGATLDLPGKAVFQYPLRRGNDGVTTGDPGDWHEWFGLQFDVQLFDDGPVTIEVTLDANPIDETTRPFVCTTTITGRGHHAALLPFDRFEIPLKSNQSLGNVGAVTLNVKGEGDRPGKMGLRDVRIVRAENIWLTAPVRGRSVDAGNAVEYPIVVGNCTDQTQAVSLSFERTGYEAMTPTVVPQTLQVPPHGTAAAIVRVDVPKRIPPGGHETQTLAASGNGIATGSAKLSFVTTSRLGYPNILHTQDEWDQVRAHVKNYDWAKQGRDDYVGTADKWNVPEVSNKTNPKRGDWLFATQQENNFMASGIAYQLTGDRKYADNVRTFLLRLSDPEGGYPVTRRACNQASVQEGHFFQHIAMSYDMTIPSGVFSDADRRQIDQTLRLFAEPEPGVSSGQISNWNVSSLCGQLYCALVMQDLWLADQIMHRKAGLIDQLVQGTLDDGWWYEVSISYNTWCATEFTQMAVAMRPWGVDLVNTSFPNAYRSNEETPPSKEEYGMSKARWGPIYHNETKIKRLWDALPPVVDWRGVLFGLNDSSEKPIVGTQMDIAYYLYRDPAYATIIKRSGKRDLLYAVPELPENTSDRSLDSTFADNAGVAVLRSQTQDRPPRERIQAVLRYGDHGWYHGHFDITDLVHLSRYGRSFYNPEFIWYGYPSYLYKFYVQTSVSKNMVVVDQKMQEPTESQRLLFHTGPMMQAAVVQTNARWSNPPYGGIVYDDQSKSFPEKSFLEGRSIPVPQNAPPYAKFGSVTGYTEPILQRRLTVVTDDYVVLADYVKGEREHTFEQLFQMHGFQNLDAGGKTLARHTGQWNPDPLSSAQFVTDCDWYTTAGPARTSFQYRFGPGEKNTTLENIPGTLNVDVHSAWPAAQEIMIGNAPEGSQPVNRKVAYAVRGDGKTLAEGKSGMWILGQVDLDVPLDNVQALELETSTDATKLGTLFWAGARVVTTDGKEIPIAQLPLKFDGTVQPKETGQDFEGGPVKIAGVPYPAALSAQPQDGKRPSVIRVDLSSIKASRLKTVLGGDYPVGDETRRWKTIAVRVTGTEARFLTVIEPFEDKRMVKYVTAPSGDSLRVELADGRVQTIDIKNFTGTGIDIGVTLKEDKEGLPQRRETTAVVH